MAVKTVKRSFTTKVTFSTQSGLTPIVLGDTDAENFYSAWMNGHYERPFVFEKTADEVTTTVSVKKWLRQKQKTKHWVNVKTPIRSNLWKNLFTLNRKKKD